MLYLIKLIKKKEKYTLIIKFKYVSTIKNTIYTQIE